jgi:HSP20 family protein
MAQNERQSTEAAAQSGPQIGGTPGAQSGSASTEQRRTSTGSATESTLAGPESTETGGRLSRRETQDPFAGIFGASPFALFRLLSDDMDRLFFGGGTQGQGQLGAFGGRFMPQVDIEEHDDRLVVRADLPGVKPDDFRVDVDDGALVVQGERRDEREDTRRGIRRFERSYGSFRRVIPLPPGANVEKADARFENGVLQIEIPLQQSRSRRLDVRSASSQGTSSSTSSKSSEDTRH